MVRERIDPLYMHIPRVTLAGVEFDCLNERDVGRLVLAELAAGRGGHIVTPNVDILRMVSCDEEARTHVQAATIVVADGSPLIWASRLAGRPLPARVPGSDLIWSLSAGLAGVGRSVYLLGGEPGAAEKAAAELARRFPKLIVAGYESPPFGFDSLPEQYAAVCDKALAAQPDLVLVGLGFPKQERVIARLRERMPTSWYMGCGAAIGFVAGTHSRAPRWMQRFGLEWLHRLGREPRRLMRRYLVHGVPFAARLLVTSVLLGYSIAGAEPARRPMDFHE